MASTSSQSDYGSSDYLNALNSYMAELQRVNNKFQEFDRQRFTFIKAIERDHLVNGTGHLYIQCIQALEASIPIMISSTGDRFLDFLDSSIKNCKILESLYILGHLGHFWSTKKSQIFYEYISHGTKFMSAEFYE